MIPSKEDRLRKGDLVESRCHQCGNDEMRVTTADYQKGGAFFWYRCPKCGAVDDGYYYYDESPGWVPERKDSTK